MKKLSLDRNKIKYLAIAAMLCDHIAMFMLSPGISEAPAGRVAVYALMRTIGRLTAPIMLFFLVEGFVHTSSRKKYGVRLLVFGLISQVPYALSHYGTLLKLDLNMIITLFITFLMLLAEEKIVSLPLRRITVFALIMSTFCCDWGVIGPFMAWLFYKFREDRRSQLRAYSVVCAIQVAAAVIFLAKNGYHWYGELWQAGMFLAIPVLLCYNGRPGSRSPVNKWVFYVFYPLHLLIFWIIKFRI
ncbi:MAG: hypothetical protein IJ071_11595 [Ruminococcus sp.]|nr:hypothetical protein [Ruminococcus sp.]